MSDDGKRGSGRHGKREKKLSGDGTGSESEDGKAASGSGQGNGMLGSFLAKNTLDPAVVEALKVLSQAGIVEGMKALGTREVEVVVDGDGTEGADGVKSDGLGTLNTPSYPVQQKCMEHCPSYYSLVEERKRTTSLVNQLGQISASYDDISFKYEATKVELQMQKEVTGKERALNLRLGQEEAAKRSVMDKAYKESLETKDEFIKHLKAQLEAKDGECKQQVDLAQQALKTSATTNTTLQADNDNLNRRLQGLLKKK